MIHDPLPHYYDPQPAKFPRPPIPLWRHVVAWGAVAVFVPCFFVATAQAIFAVMK